MHSHRETPIASRAAKINRIGLDAVLASDQKKLVEFKCEYCNKVNVKHYVAAGHAKFCNRKCSALNNAKLGNLSYERSAKTRKKQSLAMQKKLVENPETVHSWSPMTGWYKGIFFRSSFEYFFMKHLEEQGLNIRTDVVMNAFAIPYEWEGRIHSYVPDFFVPSLKTVFETKSYFELMNNPQVQAKKDAAIAFLEARQVHYEILTEKELKIPSNIRANILLDECACLVPRHDFDDRFQAMFDQQEQFMKLLQAKRDFPQFPLDLRKKENQKVLKELMHECMHEIFEAVHLLKNSKSHRETDVTDFDKDAFLEEISDATHYIVEICILMGFSARDVFSAFAKKGTINGHRIFSGY